MRCATRIRDKVAVVGVGCCQFGENWDQAPSDMIVDAAYEAYADAGIEDPQRQIDAVFTGSIYSNKGPHECSDALKLFGKPVTMVSNYCATGTDAFRCGVFVDRGRALRHRARGRLRQAEGPRRVRARRVMMDRVRDLPQTPAGWFALCASTYFAKYGAGREELAQIAVKNHKNGTLAPKSFLKREITRRGGAQRAHDLVAVRALRLRRADRRRRRGDRHARRPRAKGFRAIRPREGRDGASPGPNPQKDPSNDFLSLEADRAGRRATSTRRPASRSRSSEIDVAQVHDCFTLTELLTYEDLGFCEKGAAKEHIAAGIFELGGELPVNTDGGLKTFGHPTGATGVRMIYENVLQLRGKAGQRQVKDATLALSHNIGGHPTACGIAILGKS